MPPSEVQEVCANVGAEISDVLGLSCVVRDSVSWYNQRFDTCGDWQSWIWETVNGKEYATRQPHFSGYVVCTERLGRAGAEIVGLALRRRKGVLAWSQKNPLRSVLSVRAINEDSWLDGWAVETKAIRRDRE